MTRPIAQPSERHGEDEIEQVVAGIAVGRRPRSRPSRWPRGYNRRAGPVPSAATRAAGRGRVFPDRPFEPGLFVREGRAGRVRALPARSRLRNAGQRPYLTFATPGGGIGPLGGIGRHKGLKILSRKRVRVRVSQRAPLSLKNPYFSTGLRRFSGFVSHIFYRRTGLLPARFPDKFRPRCEISRIRFQSVQSRRRSHVSNL